MFATTHGLEALLHDLLMIVLIAVGYQFLREALIVSLPIAAGLTAVHLLRRRSRET